MKESSFSDGRKNISLLKIRNRTKKLDVKRVVSINKSPIMLLPKAKVRDNYDIYGINRPFSVIPADDYNTLYLSTLVADSDALREMAPSRSSLKSRRYSRSDADSGFHSLKRYVSFGEMSLSRSTIYKSVEDLDMDTSHPQEYVDTVDNVSPRSPSPFTPCPHYMSDTEYENPEYIDSFGDTSIPKLPKLPSRYIRTEKHRVKTPPKNQNPDVCNCSICSAMADRAKVQRHFGGIDKFLDWIYSSWGKKRSDQPLTRSNYVYRGRNPKFCNIVSQIQLHGRKSSRPSTPQDDSDYDDTNYLQKTFDANLIGRLRRTSAESEIPHTPKESTPVTIPKVEPSETPELKKDGTDGRPTTPSSVTEKDESPEIEIVEEVNDVEEDDNLLLDNDVEDIMTPIIVVESKPTTTTTTEKDQVDSKEVPPVIIPSTDDNFDDVSARDTPKQPPPSPEPIIVPKSPDTPPPAKRRTCHTKKTKKTVTKTRKTKEMKKEEPPKIDTEPLPPTPPEEKIPDKKDITVDIGLPDLPTYSKDEKQRQNKEHRKPERHLVTKQPHEEKLPGPKELLEDLQNKHYEFTLDEIPLEEPVKKMNRSLPEFRGRLALSQRSARFELPMDMKVLETISAQDYIMQYCRITERRQRLYDKKFYEHKDKINNVIPFEKLEKAMKEVLVDTITAEDFKNMMDLLEIPKDAKINSEFFAALCALGERVLYPNFVTVETKDIAEYKREMIECADFCGLDWKLHGVNVKPKTYKLLKQLTGTRSRISSSL